jgi:hypothetical protein
VLNRFLGDDTMTIEKAQEKLKAGIDICLHLHWEVADVSTTIVFKSELYAGKLSEFANKVNRFTDGPASFELGVE